MNKNRISHQQRQRIASKQNQALAAANIGLVVSHHGKILEVLIADEIFACSKKQHLGPIVPGDKVAVDKQKVIAIKPRHSILARPNYKGDMQAVAANINYLFITIAPTPSPAHTTIDRYIIAAEASNIVPIILLNKNDLLTDSPEREKIEYSLNLFRNLGYISISLNTKNDNILEKLKLYLTENISVFVGQSGVGKSSIITKLTGDENIRTGSLTSANHGKHTTSSSRLYKIPGVTGNIIDSPGIREFPLWPMTHYELAKAFIEFRPFILECKFKNCTHINERACAVAKAVQENKITLIRYQSYQLLYSQLSKTSR